MKCMKIFVLVAFLSAAGFWTTQNVVRGQDNNEDKFLDLQPGGQPYGAEIQYNNEGQNVKLRFTNFWLDHFAPWGRKVSVDFEYKVPGNGVLGTPDRWQGEKVTIPAFSSDDSQEAHTDVAILIRGKKGVGGTQAFCVRTLGYQSEGGTYTKVAYPESFICISVTGEKTYYDREGSPSR